MMAAPVTPTISLFPRQKRFVQERRRFVAAIGGIGSGKTFVGAAKTIARMNRPELGLVCAPTFPMLRDATQRTLLELMRDLGIQFTFNKTDNHLVIPSTGHEILFRSLDDPDRMRGPNVGYAWVDEAPYITAQAARIVKGRIRVGDYQQLWITGTPKGRNWVYEEWVVNTDERHALYQFSTRENVMLDPDFVPSLGYEGQFAAQELDGEFVGFDGLVYQFDRNSRAVEVDTTGWRTVLCVDVGARNPTAVLTLKVAGDDRMHVEREFWQRGMSSSQILAAIEAEAKETRPEEIFIDPSAAAYIDDLLANGYPATKADNDVLVGIQRVTTAIADGLTVDPSCVHTLAEFEQYQYPEEGKRGGDKPVKQNDHCLVAGTMVETIDGPVPIEQVDAGTLVLTRQGYRRVVACGMTNQKADVIQVLLSNGADLMGTGGHPVWANGDWVPMDTLRYGDIMEGFKEPLSCEWKSLSSTGSLSADTPTPPSGHNDPITRRMQDIGGAASDDYTKRFGRWQTVLSRMGTIFTTSISTQQTTQLRTWHASLVRSIKEFTESGVALASILQNNVNTSPAFVLLHPHGIDQMRGGHGTENTGSKRGLNGIRKCTPAFSAASSLSQSLSARVIGFARIVASLRGVEPQESMTRIERAQCAARHSESIATARPEPVPVRVVAVSKVPQRQAVYNLTVEGVPEYFANGLLVHNCMDALRYGVMGVTAPRINLASYYRSMAGSAA